MPRRLAPPRLDFGEEAPLVDHLSELRHRIVFSLVALVAMFALCYAFRAHIIGWLEEPLPPEHRKLITLSPAEPFITSLMVSLTAAFILAFPVIIYQVWAFFAPALNPRIQRAVVGMTAFAALLAGLGLAFAYYVALPASVRFLTSYDDDLYTIDIRARDYFSFATMVMLAVTVVFQLPIVILGLVAVRILSYEKLKRNRRLGFVLMAVLAVCLPGVDPITTVIQMIPLMILFEGSIWAAYYIEKRRKRRALARGESDDEDGLDTEDEDDAAASAWSPDDEEPEPFVSEPIVTRDPRDRDDI